MATKPMVKGSKFNTFAEVVKMSKDGHTPTVIMIGEDRYVREDPSYYRTKLGKE